MMRLERHARITEFLYEQGSVTVAALAELTAVSEMTVRRDLEKLERQGVCRRVHGGAVLPPGRGTEAALAERRDHHVDAKRRIGRWTAAQIASGETVLLDIGSTTLAVAEALASRGNLTVITPSLDIAILLADGGDNRTICLGGIVRRGEHSVVGSLTERALEEFHVDVCVLSAGGVSVVGGITEYHPEGAEVKRLMLRRAQRSVLVVDESKLGIQTFAVVAPLDAVDQVVTSAHPVSGQLLALHAAGVDVVNVAEEDGAAPSSSGG